ncbi:MAG: DUF937 domain-containing protein [Rhizobacter sp.]|nr:DUF937 domain-containing protein [Chlorobiales bacterium]
MTDIMNLITSQLGSGAVQQLSQNIGADENATQKAITAAVPLLLSALARNASSPGGAESLYTAVSRDHDGSALDNVMNLVGNTSSGNGAGILNHVLGSQQPAVQQGLAKSTGLDAGTIAQILQVAAPLVLGALGRTQQQQGFDAGGLSQFLGTQQQQAQAQQPDLMGTLGRLLDSNHDGNMMDDVGNVLGKFLK